ncbi:MAG: hypothetical protein PUF56_00090 [Lachnospiraceae bacterium]|nr:hypothetical protein [Lachnospiraceae bacterium]
MKKKVIIGILLVALVVVAGFVGFHHHKELQEKKAIAVEQAKEEKAKNLRFQKLQSEYDTAEKQIENALYPNADGTMPDDAAMNQSRDGKKQELVAFEKKIKDKKLTAKEEKAFHTFVSSIADTYKASQTAVDTLHTEVAGIDPNQYSTYYTDAHKTDTETNLSAYDKAYQEGKYRDAYSALTKVKATYASVDAAKKQAEEQAALAAQKAEEEKAQKATQSAQNATQKSAQKSAKKAQTKGQSNTSSQTPSPAPTNTSQSTGSSAPAPSSESNEDHFAGAWDTPGYKAACDYADAHGGQVVADTFGNHEFSYWIKGADGKRIPGTPGFNDDGSTY